MKTLLILLSLVSLAFSSEEIKPIDISGIVNEPPAATLKAWGKPYLTDPPNESAHWTVGEFDVTAYSRKNKIVLLMFIPEGDTQIPGKEPYDAASFLRLTKDNGWNAVDVLKVGVRNEIVMEHKEKGRWILTALKYEGNEGFSGITFQSTAFKWP